MTALGWQSEAACVGMPDKVFFDQIPSYISRARFVCSLCPVMAPCVLAAVENGDRGIRGGLTYQERKRVHHRPLVHHAPYREGVA